MVPPEVKSPAPHVLQVEAPSPEYIVSLPHGVHAKLPATAEVPAVQSVCTELPEHELPAGHLVQVVRVLVPLPPEVKEPLRQSSQAAAP